MVLRQMTMRRLARIATVLASLLAAAGITAQENRATNDVPLMPEEIRGLVVRAIAHQHGDDRELDAYDRTEHVIRRDSGKDAAATESTARVIPGGAGELRVELDRNGKPADAVSIEQQWRDVEKTLAARSNPDDPLVRQEYQRAERRNRAHAEMIDAVGKAFRFAWAGRTTRDGRRMIELAYEPDPAYKSSARFAGVFAHTRGFIWLDESSGHVARVEAELRDDVSFGGGLLGKIYRGSRLTVEQAETAPGVWLPVRWSYDIEGRKFLFVASWHGQGDADGYRRLGPPPQALQLIRRERGDVVSSEREEAK